MAAASGVPALPRHSGAFSCTLPFRSTLSEFFGVPTAIHVVAVPVVTSAPSGVGLRRAGVPGCATRVAWTAGAACWGGAGLSGTVVGCATTTGCAAGSGVAACIPCELPGLTTCTMPVGETMGPCSLVAAARDTSAPIGVIPLPRQSGVMSCTLAVMSRLSPFLGVAIGPHDQLLAAPPMTSSPRTGTGALRRPAGVVGPEGGTGCWVRSGTMSVSSVPRACSTLLRMLRELLGSITRMLPEPRRSECFGVANSALCPPDGSSPTSTARGVAGLPPRDGVPGTTPAAAPGTACSGLPAPASSGPLDCSTSFRTLRELRGIMSPGRSEFLGVAMRLGSQTPAVCAASAPRGVTEQLRREGVAMAATVTGNCCSTAAASSTGAAREPRCTSRCPTGAGGG
mmetsp:Transcript_18202/g.57846  ORF Transcript_18202/g.57846 Transcript_18202/m.57846 type:complete len:398 (+) Transcript_18202:168-1361(+)